MYNKRRKGNMQSHSTSVPAVYSGFVLNMMAYNNGMHMNQRTTKRTIWHVRPAKTQISLGVRLVFAVRMKKAWVLIYQLSAKRRLIRQGECPG